MNIPGVPDSIEWETVKSFLEGIGISLNDVPRGHPVEIGYDAIKCRMYASNEHGDRYLAEDGETVAMHHIVIPVHHPERDNAA